MNTAILKRLADIKLTVLALLVLSPVMAVVSVLVRIGFGSPVFFRQQRPGLNGEPFEIMKFRTMTNERDAEGVWLSDEQRLTALGRLLRRTSLDELPELLNVLKGDMSLVGPRPLLMSYLDRYSAEQARRHDVLPGLTGWAQVNGRNAISWEDKLAYDVWYVDHANFWLDMKIIMMTVWQVLTGRGVAAEGHVTMPEFRGSDRE